MGGKQSTESAGESQSFDDRPESSNGGLTTSRRQTVIGGSMRTHRRVLQFEPTRPSTNMGPRDLRMARTNSAIESGLRIPRHRLSWLYHRDNTGDGDSSPDEENGRTSDPSRFMTWLRDRSQVSQSLPPYLIAPMRGIYSPILITLKEVCTFCRTLNCE